MRYLIIIFILFLTACNNIEPQPNTKDEQTISNHIQQNQEEAKLAQFEYEKLKNKRQNI
jgi:predicted transcriptional regulator